MIKPEKGEGVSPMDEMDDLKWKKLSPIPPLNLIVICPHCGWANQMKIEGVKGEADFVCHSCSQIITKTVINRRLTEPCPTKTA